MPAPDLVLQKPYVLVQPTNSQLSGNTSGGGLNFGVVTLIYATCDTYAVDDVVMYSTQGQILVEYDSIEYAIITDDKIYYREGDPV